MGPFKQIKDGGLDTRKVAFECMYTLLDNSLDRLDIFEFLQHVEDGLKDHYDIKVSWMAHSRSHYCRNAQEWPPLLGCLALANRTLMIQALARVAMGSSCFNLIVGGSIK